MEHDWERADVHARIVKPGYVSITASNVSELKLMLGDLREVTINNAKVPIVNQRTHFSWHPPAYLGSGTTLEGTVLTWSEKQWRLDQPPCLACKHPWFAGPIDAA